MNDIVTQQISDKIEAIRPAIGPIKGVKSWIKYIRQSLGMSAAQLAQRMKLKPVAIYKFESNEALDQLSLKTLKKAAEAMDSYFIYAIIPRKKLESLIDDQATQKAYTILKETRLHMQIEDQDISDKAFERRLRELKDKLKHSKALWEDETL